MGRHEGSEDLSEFDLKFLQCVSYHSKVTAEKEQLSVNDVISKTLLEDD
jgi:hypothetical protein